MKKLIAIVGMSGSGKSVASDYLEKEGFNKIYFGGVVLDTLKSEGLEINPDNEKMMRERLRNGSIDDYHKRLDQILNEIGGMQNEENDK